MRFKELRKVMKSYQTIEVHYTAKNGRYIHLPCFIPELDGARYDDDKVTRIECNVERRLLSVYLLGAAE